MKVTAVDTCVLTVPTPKPMALQYPQHKLVVAQIDTDQGIRGLGYSLVFGGGGAEAVHAYVERLKPALIGEDPTYVELPVGKDVPRRHGDEEAGRRGLRALRARHRPVGHRPAKRSASRCSSSGARCAIASPATAAAAGRSTRLDDLVREAEKYAAQGCRYYKMKIHDPDPKVNRARVEAVKRAVGPERAPDGRRQPAPRRARQPAPGGRARAPRPRLVRGTGAGRRHPRLRRGGGENQHPGGHRRKQLHALRVPRADRAQCRDAI